MTLRSKYFIKKEIIKNLLKGNKDIALAITVLRKTDPSKDCPLTLEIKSTIEKLFHSIQLESKTIIPIFEISDFHQIEPEDMDSICSSFEHLLINFPTSTTATLKILGSIQEIIVKE